MKKKVTLLYVLSILCVSLSFCSGCSYLNKKAGLKDDNIIETYLEDVIQSETGLDVDLTPNNPDEDDYTFDIWRKD